MNIKTLFASVLFATTLLSACKEDTFENFKHYSIDGKIISTANKGWNYNDKVFKLSETQPNGAGIVYTYVFHRDFHFDYKLTSVSINGKVDSSKAMLSKGQARLEYLLQEINCYDCNRGRKDFLVADSLFRDFDSKNSKYSTSDFLYW